MKIIIIALLALTLSGCAEMQKEQQEAAAKQKAQAQQQAQMQRNVANYIAATCDKSGFVRGTLQYKECQMKMINMIFPSVDAGTTCVNYGGFFTCSQ